MGFVNIFQRYYYQDYQEAIENTPGIMPSETPIETPITTSESLGNGLYQTDPTYPMTSAMQTPLMPQEYQQPYMPPAQPAMEQYPEVATTTQTPYQMQQSSLYQPAAPPPAQPAAPPPAAPIPQEPTLPYSDQSQPAPQPYFTQPTQPRPKNKLIQTGQFPEAQPQMVASPSSE